MSTRRGQGAFVSGIGEQVDRGGLKVVVAILLVLLVPTIGLVRSFRDCSEAGSGQVIEINNAVSSEKIKNIDLGWNPPVSTSFSGTGEPILIYDNGVMNLTVKDSDIPKGPCDFGDLVRAARSYLYPGTSKTAGEALDMAAVNRMKLVTELDKCEPSK